MPDSLAGVVIDVAFVASLTRLQKERQIFRRIPSRFGVPLLQEAWLFDFLKDFFLEQRETEADVKRFFQPARLLRRLNAMGAIQAERGKVSRRYSHPIVATDDGLPFPRQNVKNVRVEPGVLIDETQMGHTGESQRGVYQVVPLRADA